MKDITRDIAQEIIESKEIEKFDEYLEICDEFNPEIFSILFKMKEIETIEAIYKRNRTEEIKKLIFNSVIIFCYSFSASKSVFKSLRMILNDGSNEFLSLNDDEDIYRISQFDGNLELFEILSEFNIKVEWAYALQFSCEALIKETVMFLCQNHTFSQEDIDLAFHSIICSSIIGSKNHELQAELISYFIKEMNADINQEASHEWDYLFLECFQNSPDSAYIFYKDNFNTKIFETEDFWENLIEEHLESNEKNEYKKAFKDLKNSGLDISFIESVFAKENKTALFEELTK